MGNLLHHISTRRDHTGNNSEFLCSNFRWCQARAAAVKEKEARADTRASQLSAERVQLEGLRDTLERMAATAGIELL